MGTIRQNHQVNWKDEDIKQLYTERISMSFAEIDQACRAISTSKLHASPHFHTWPINVVVYHGSQRSLVLR